MLIKLSIKNYALIDELSVNFSDGFSIITGETGAGKSILLGALGLVLGKRADLSALNKVDKKCVIEAEFLIKDYKLEIFFSYQDLDYEHKTIIRREILPSGKSRAFVNDTPVKLSTLISLQSRLIDIHSQHQTLQLSDSNFQFYVIDALAKNQKKIDSYKRGLKKYNLLFSELEKLKKTQEFIITQHKYNLHLLNELTQANIKLNEQNELEDKLEKLNNIEDIKLNISNALQMSVNEDFGIQALIYEMDVKIQKISFFSKEFKNLSNRISSVKIELDDIIYELENLNETVDCNPSELQRINDRLELIYNIQKKHKVSSIKELKTIEIELSKKVNQVENISDVINKKELELNKVSVKLNELSDLIFESRLKSIPKLKKDLIFLMNELSMKDARFSINLEHTNNYFSNGRDKLEFLFSANKGSNFGELKKNASGGELSRIMLSIKKILSEKIKLPTIIFDEIDTGVSGDVSNKIAKIMQKMSENMQVMAITHLPQIASKGNKHYKVYKQEINGVTSSNLKELTQKDRVFEIAEMLSGKNITESALIHAKQLLN